MANRMYSYKSTIVRLIDAEPDRVLLQNPSTLAVAWADWEEFHEKAMPCDEEEVAWRAEEVSIDGSVSAWCVCRTMLGTGNKYRQSNLEVFDGGRLYVTKESAEDIAKLLNQK